MNADETTCPPDRLWLDWATDRWLDLDPESPEAGALLKEIFRENARLWLRRDPRRLPRRDVLRRRDPETLRTMIWLRNRKMLRARGVGLRSVPAGRQLDPAFPRQEGALDRRDSYGDGLRDWAAKVEAKDVFWLRTQCDLHAISEWLLPEARAALQEPSRSELPDYVNHSWRKAAASGMRQAAPKPSAGTGSCPIHGLEQAAPKPSAGTGSCPIHGLEQATHGVSAAPDQPFPHEPPMPPKDRP